MKILMVILHFPPVFRGGAELQCWKQARALAARGHEVTVLTQWLSVRTPRREMKDGVLIRRLGGLLPVTFGARKLRARLRRSAARGAAGEENAPPAENAPAKKGFRCMAPAARESESRSLHEALPVFRAGTLSAAEAAVKAPASPDPIPGRTGCAGNPVPASPAG